MDFLPEKVDEYIEKMTSDEPAVLKKLNRETHAKVLRPRMLSGHLQGRVLSMFSKMIRPKYILEIGTYTGYAANCMAEGLQEGGELHTIDINEELEDMIRRYISEAGNEDKIHVHIGNALEIIPDLDYDFDLVFIDADKENYSAYYDLLIEKMKPGSYILADNVLWSGKVVEEVLDAETKALKDFSRKVMEDVRVENVLLPIRDGLMLVRLK